MKTDLGMYTLDAEGNPVHEPDTHKWAEWMETADRTVQQDTVNGLWISTVFLGLDHSFGDGPPLLFETMVFNRSDKEHPYADLDCKRYATLAEAKLGHQLMLSTIATTEPEKEQK